jgi:endonuclease YncB( thermonuclease family)
MVTLVVPEPIDQRTRVLDSNYLGQATFATTRAATDLGGHDGQLVNVSLWLVEQGWAVTFENHPTAETDDAPDPAGRGGAGGPGHVGNLHVVRGGPMTRVVMYGLLSIAGRLLDDAAVVGRGRCLRRSTRLAGWATLAARATTAPAESVVDGLDAATRYDHRPPQIPLPGLTASPR